MNKFFFLLFIPLTGWSQQMSSDQLLGQLNTISTAVPFLRIAPDARAGGMGDGSVALSNDANAMYWNPARLAFNQKKSGFAASYAPWLRALVPDINHFYGAAYYKPDSVSAIGCSFRYFSFGETTWSMGGMPVAAYRPWEMAFDIGYSRKLRDNLSAGVTGRFIQSRISPYFTGTSGRNFAFDIGLAWTGDEFSSGNWHGHLQSGLAITNIGPKMVYADYGTSKEFLPANLALAFGGEFVAKEKHFLAVQVEANKLLVPSPPVYAIDTNGNPVVVNGQYVIAAGKDPNRSMWEGITGSFSDAPGGAQEELQEITWSAGVEYDFKRIVKVRAGFFYEHPKKGNRQYATFGVGGRYKMVALDISYLYPTNAQRSPLENTWKLTLLVHLPK